MPASDTPTNPWEELETPSMGFKLWGIAPPVLLDVVLVVIVAPVER